MATISADLRHKVIERAENCCEYCLLSQEDYLFPYHIDHIVAEKHAGKTQLDNLCLSCPVCNTFKGSDLGSLDPATGEFSYLYNPRKQDGLNISASIMA